MPNLRDLENLLQNLKVKPKLSFRIKLALKLRLKMWQLSPLNYKLATTFAILTVFVSTIFGLNFYNYRTSYAFYFDQAQNDLNILTNLIQGKENEVSFILPIALANQNILNELEITNTMGKIIYSTEKGLSLIDSLSNLPIVEKAISQANNLQSQELRVFGHVAEVAKEEKTLITVINAIQITSENKAKIRQISLNIAEAKNQGKKKIVIDLKPKLISTLIESSSPKRENFAQIEKKELNPQNITRILTDASILNGADNTLEKKQILAENHLKNIITSSPENEEVGVLSERYLKAIESLEKNHTFKAIALLTSIEKESSEISAQNEPVKTEDKSQIALLEDKNDQIDQIIAETEDSETETTKSTIIEDAEQPESEPSSQIAESNDLAKVPQSESGSSTLDTKEVLIPTVLNQKEKIEFVSDLLESQESSQTEDAIGAKNEIENKPKEDESSLNEDQSENDSTATKEEFLVKTIPLESKIRIWKEEKKKELLEEAKQKIEEEKKLLTDEAKKKEEEKTRLEEEQKQKETQKNQEEENKKRAMELELKLQEQQRKNEQEALLIEEKKKAALIEKQKLEEEQRRIEAEKNRLQLERNKNDEQERTKLEFEQQKKEEEARKLKEEIGKKQAEQKILDEEQRRIEAEKKLIEEAKQKQEQETSRIKFEIVRQEEEKGRIEEAIKKQIEEKKILEQRRELIETKGQKIEEAVKKIEESLKKNPENQNDTQNKEQPISESTSSPGDGSSSHSSSGSSTQTPTDSNNPQAGSGSDSEVKPESQRVELPSQNETTSQNKNTESGSPIPTTIAPREIIKNNLQLKLKQRLK